MPSEIRRRLYDLCAAIAQDKQFKDCQEKVNTFIDREDEFPGYAEMLDLQEKHEEEGLSEEEQEQYKKLAKVELERPEVKEFMASAESLEHLSILIDEAMEAVFETGAAPEDLLED